MTPELAAIVVMYRSESCIEACLRALVGETAAVNIVLWDNASPDRSAELATAVAPGAALVRSERNLGFAAAVNRAAKRFEGRDLLLLNPDAVLQPGAVQALTKALCVHSLVAVAGSRLIDAGGDARPDAWAFPTPLRTTAGAFVGLGRAYAVHRRPLDGADEIGDAFVPFTAALLRRVAFEAVGGLDENFFMYGEDADYCYRVHRAGWEIVVARGATACHLGGASSDAAFRGSAVLRGGDRFREKHFSRLGGLSAAAALRLGAAARLGWEAVASRITAQPRSRSEWRDVRRHYGR